MSLVVIQLGSDELLSLISNLLGELIELVQLSSFEACPPVLIL